jgi:hypothetical protein
LASSTSKGKATAGELRPEPVKITKVSVNLPEAMVSQLRALADSEGETFTQVLKEAIALKFYVTRALADGAELLVKRPDGTVREIVFGL